MSDIVLTAAVRQNLLSLQGTADLLSTTQTRLATGKKVNSALDNPTNYFTAAGLDARAGDISNLLDSIGNGVQVLQAANTGITSLQKLVDTAKSIANQALQQPTGYGTKSSIAFTGTGAGVAPAGPATAADLTTSKLNGGVYTFTNSAGTAVTITVGTAASAFNSTTKTATVKTLDQLNTALAVAGVNLSASITGPDDLTFTSTNDGAAQTITGTAAATAPTTLDAINISANALGGGAGGTDFIDNVLTGKVLTALNNASSTLRSQASAFGANLSIVQIRQDFAKNIINVLQTGSANLTLADSNEEAANSQALSTRQSIAVSALALANQSQQSVLKLLQ